VTGEPVFPVVVKDGAFCVPDAPAYYVVAANGLFLVRRTDIFTACVPVDGGVPGLLHHEPRLALDLPRLPRSLLERAVGFFRAVWERWEGEAILVLFYDRAEGRPPRFALGAPPQRLRGRFEGGRFRAELRLDYASCEKPAPEWRRMGTIHSHGNFGPAHSGIDAHDEVYDAGLHVTAGYVNSRSPAFGAVFVVGGTRFAVPADDVLPSFHTPRRFPASWMDRVVVTCDGWTDNGRRHDAR
jgi:hypothetical protein